MSKKLLILISIIGVLLIAGGVALALALNNKPAANDSEAVVEKPICTLVARENIVTALNIQDKALGEAIDQGQLNDQEGTTRTCSYQLGVKTNMIYNNVTITATTFKSEELRKNAIARFDVAGVKAETVDGLTTYFSSLKTAKVEGPVNGPASDVPAQNSYKLYVYKGMKVYTYGVVAAASNDIFKDKNEAKQALSTLVRAADL